MSTVKELIRTGRKEELWQMCCGFLDLSLDQFMSIQNRLLLEQIELLNNCALGKKVMKGIVPQNVEEFRKRVPLTTYKDYCPELQEKREEVLPVKPVYWQHTSGRSTEYPFKWESIKWVPVTPGFCLEVGVAAAACGILSSCRHKGDMSSINNNLKYIYAVAPRPYTSGTYAYIVSDETGIVSLPPLEKAEKMSFEQRIEVSFKEALAKGLDFYFGVSVALVAIGERMSQRMNKIDVRSLLMQPGAFFRILKGLIKSRIAGRPLQPRDIWNLKGILSSGTDGTIFKEIIKQAWGRYPLNMYASTEAGIVATQAWDYGSMTFIPSGNFLEFIPEEEYTRWQADNSYMPRTVLLSEVAADKRYELVITNFHGGPLARYRTGDVIKITSLQNANLNIRLPQMEFDGRVDDVLDIGGFVRLTEKVIWQAISNTNIPYVDWAARKITAGSRSYLEIYIELKTGTAITRQQAAEAIYRELKKMDEDFMYGNIEDVLQTMPLEVTFLPQGAFENYINLRRSQGADLAHLKPRHINPSDKELAILGMAQKPAEIITSVPAGVSSGN